MPSPNSFLNRLRLSDTQTGDRLVQLFLVSFAALYVEMMLIRWVGTEFRLFAYFQNLTLIACFLGFGYGCLKAEKKLDRLFEYGSLAILAVVIDFPWREWKRVLEVLGVGLSLSNDLSTWHEASASVVAWRSLMVSATFVTGVLLLLIAIMAPLGSWVARYIARTPNTVLAYSVNLAGSLAGMWFFAGMSFLRLPPIYWFAVAFLLALLMQPSWKKTGPGTVLAMVVCGLTLALGGMPEGKVVWSPYQKLEIVEVGNANFNIKVNNAGYMSIANLSPEELAKDPELAKSYREESSYETPYRFVRELDSVLIVGSGAGNDVAAALRHKAASIDAVEIDPAIRDFGRAHHPEKPYDAPQVHVTIDDARDFMHRTTHRYDLILFALLDSHTQSSSLSSMRIDNYVYTQEAFEEAKRLLKPDGILVLKFEVRPAFGWLGQRFYGELGRVFGRPPIVYYNPQVYALLQGTIYVVSTSDAAWTRSQTPELSAFLAEHPPRFPLPAGSHLALTTDDWPYIYQRDRAIPRIYLILSSILLGLALLLVRKSFAYRQQSTWHFFLLGAGFLLLETQMVSRLALFFGSTWIVNCVALTFILTVLMAANFFLTRIRVQRLAPYYLFLILFLAGVYFTPWTQLPLSTRMAGILLGTAYSLPLFFAGIIFTESFRRARGSSECFGANILGAVAGGLAQNLSFIIGMKALLLIAVVFYAAAGALNLFPAETSRSTPTVTA